MRRTDVLTAAVVSGFLVGCGAEGPRVPEAGDNSLATPTTPTAEGSAIRIMPLGDSITQADAKHDSYRRPLFHALAASGRSVDFVGSQTEHHRGGPPHDDFDRDHEGHWGFRVDEILERLPDWVEAHEPQVVLVHLGSNDVFQRQPNEETVRELSELIDLILAAEPEATILLAKIISTTTPAANQRILDFNGRLDRLAAGRVGRVRLVDHHDGFDASRMTYDGVHPNEEGERHMAERWLEALEPVLP